MRRLSLTTPGQVDEESRIEFYLRVNKGFFAISFLDLEEAIIMAREINKSGRSVEICEKRTGNIVVKSAGWAKLSPIEARDLQRRLLPKGHEFVPGAEECSNCGLGMMEAMASTTRCNTPKQNIDTTDMTDQS